MNPKVKLTWNNGALTELQRRMNGGILRMGFDVASRARFNAPVKTGALRNDIRVVTDDRDVYVVAGSSRVPYAKRREYENNLHPETRFYMRRAFDSVMESNWQEKYFGNLTE